MDWKWSEWWKLQQKYNFTLPSQKKKIEKWKSSNPVRFGLKCSVYQRNDIPSSGRDRDG